MQTINSPDVFDVAQLPDASQHRKINVLVVSSVALAFMSFWRAAAIVLCDLASTAYYIGGISEQAVGKAAPWFILAVMLFVYPVTSVYMESCTLFTRGGVYKVVKGAVGGGLAKLSVSALMFDYILTGPISSVAAGQYLVGLIGDMLKLATWHSAHPIVFDATTHPDIINFLTMLIAIGITAYFWRMNIIGIHESSEQGAADHAIDDGHGPADFRSGARSRFGQCRIGRFTSRRSIRSLRRRAWTRPSRRPPAGWNISHEFWGPSACWSRSDIRCLP